MSRVVDRPITRTDIIIRPLGPTDFAPWRRLWADYNAFYGRSGATALPDDIVRTSWSRLLDPVEPVYGLVAERGGELMGLAHWLTHRNMISIEDTCYLQDLFTTPAARGTGVGRALIEAFYAQAAAAGVRKIYWHTHEANETARRLYDGVATNTGFLVYRKQL